MSSRTARLQAVFFALVFAGCGSGRPAPDQLAGTVTLQRKPLTNVAITLSLEGGGPSDLLSGSSDAQGKFVLLPADRNAPIKPGSYRVVVTDPNAARPGAKKGSDRASDPYNAEQKSGDNPVIPAKYSTPDATTFKVEVKPGNPLVIDLTP